MKVSMMLYNGVLKKFMPMNYVRVKLVRYKAMQQVFVFVFEGSTIEIEAYRIKSLNVE